MVKASDLIKQQKEREDRKFLTFENWGSLRLKFRVRTVGDYLIFKLKNRISSWKRNSLQVF